MVDRVALGQVSLRVLQFSSVSVFPQILHTYRHLHISLIIIIIIIITISLMQAAGIGGERRDISNKL
jgi:hypothetical protein